MLIRPLPPGATDNAEREGRVLCVPCAEDRVGRTDVAIERGLKLIGRCPNCNRRRAVYVWHERTARTESIRTLKQMGWTFAFLAALVALLALFVNR